MESVAIKNFWQSFKYHLVIAKFVGLERLQKENMKFYNRLSMIPINLLALFFCQLIYTLVILNGDFVLTMKALYPLGIGVQVNTLTIEKFASLIF